MGKQAAGFGCFIDKESFKLEAWYTFNQFHQTDKAVIEKYS